MCAVHRGYLNIMEEPILNQNIQLLKNNITVTLDCTSCTNKKCNIFIVTIICSVIDELKKKNFERSKSDRWARGKCCVTL